MATVFAAFLIVAIASVHAVLDPNVVECQKTFRASIARTADPEQQCEAFSALSNCFMNVLVTSKLPFESLAKQIGDFASEAVSEKHNCDLTKMTFFQDQDQKDHAALNRKARSAASTFDLFDRLTAQEKARFNLQSTGTAQLDNMLARIAVVSDAYTTIVNNIFSVAVTRFGDRYNQLAALLTDVGSKYSSSVAPANTQAQDAINTQFNAEKDARTQWLASTAAPMMASLSNTVASSISAAVADRAAIRASISANSPVDDIKSQLSTQNATETTRAAAKATTQASTFNSLASTQSSAISSAFASQATRADAACTNQVTNAVWKPQQLSSTNDFGSCSTGGSYYYSVAQQTLFYCNGARYLPMIQQIVEGHWAGNTILSEEQAYTLKRQVGLTTVWTLCWRISWHGNQATTYRSLCGGIPNRENMLIGRSNDGRIWGSFGNRMIPGNTGGNWYGNNQNCWHWRFNPTGTRQIQTLSQYQQSACIYDGPGYCPYYYDGNFHLGTSGTCNIVYSSSSSSWYINPYMGDGLTQRAFNQGGNAGYFQTINSANIIDAEMWVRTY